MQTIDRENVNTQNHATHEVTNQSPDLVNFNRYQSDPLLQHLTQGYGGQWAEDSLIAFGQATGTAEFIDLGRQANTYKPVLRTHDHKGHRVDHVEFHPSYHQLWQHYREHRLHDGPWVSPQPGAHVARGAKAYMQVQVEAGMACPGTMTFASYPLLTAEPYIAEHLLPKVLNPHYDPSNAPIALKQGITIGMAVTEKQGGSDVYSNSTRAHPMGDNRYALFGHKYFVSGCMSDAFLVLAQAPEGLTCFMVPRWRPDGTKNAFELQQLKLKMGNVSNATAEAELRGALAWRIGEEGDGLRTILKSISLNRFDCALGSAAAIRAATIQAIHHCRHRMVFGKRLSQQPMMQNVLADLTLESHGACALTLRLAKALDNAATDETEKHLVRLGTGIAKYWICKRTPAHAYEAMECIGGTGAMETSVLARLYREAPINAIWEGSGNVQALDAIRCMIKDPACVEAYITELEKSRDLNTTFDTYIENLKGALQFDASIEFNARYLIERMALAWQAALLLQTDFTVEAEAFCEARLQTHAAPSLYGSLHCQASAKHIIESALVL